MTSLTTVSIALTSLLLVACSGSDGTDGEGSEVYVTPPVTIAAGTASCSDHHQGCPCENLGERVECGVVVAHRPDGRTVCAEGGQVCEAGPQGASWGECLMDGVSKTR